MLRIKNIFFVVVLILFPCVSAFSQNWEKEGHFYYLTKETRINFSLPGAGPNRFGAKYLKYGGINFLVRGNKNWQDYGRLNLERNNIFSVPIKPGIKIDELHLLAGGNYSNSYEHDPLLRLYGDKYFYSTLSVIFFYQDGTFKELSVPVFWDWFKIGPGTWSKNGATIKSLGQNPVRDKCAIYHITFTNPRNFEPVQSLLILDSWLDDRPFSDVFALTLKSYDALDAGPKRSQ